MRHWFKSARHFVFVAPVAVVMADDGGCASSGQQAMTQQEVQSAIVGNTVFSETNNAIAFINADGSIRAEISATDDVKTDVGKWTLDDQGNFCVEWTNTVHGKNNCAQFVVVKDDAYQWGGHTFTLETGNSRSL